MSIRTKTKVNGSVRMSIQVQLAPKIVSRRNLVFQECRQKPLQNQFKKPRWILLQRTCFVLEESFGEINKAKSEKITARFIPNKAKIVQRLPSHQKLQKHPVRSSREFILEDTTPKNTSILNECRACYFLNCSLVRGMHRLVLFNYTYKAIYPPSFLESFHHTFSSATPDTGHSNPDTKGEDNNTHLMDWHTDLTTKRHWQVGFPLPRKGIRPQSSRQTPQ